MTRGVIISIGLWLLSFGATLAIQPPSASIVKWKDPISGYWDDNSKWSTEDVPTAQDNVIIDSDGDYQITINVHASISSLLVQTEGATLLITKTLSIYGKVEVNGSTILAADDGLYLTGEAIFNGEFIWNGGLIEGTVNENVIMNGVFRLTPLPSRYVIDPRLKSTHVTVKYVTILREGRVYFKDGSGITISEDAFCILNSSNTIISNENGGFLINNGQVTVNANGAKVYVNFFSIGHFEMHHGDVTFLGDSTWHGNTVIGEESVLQFSGGKHSFQSTSIIHGASIKATSTAKVFVLSKQIELLSFESDLQSSILIQPTTNNSSISIDILSARSSSFLGLYLPKQHDRQICFSVVEVNIWYQAHIQLIGDVCIQRLFQSSIFTTIRSSFDVVGDILLEDSWIWEGGRLVCSGNMVVNGNTLITKNSLKHIRRAQVIFKNDVRLDTSSNLYWNKDVNVIISKDSIFTITATGGSLGSSNYGKLENYGKLVMHSQQISTYYFKMDVFSNKGSILLLSSPGSTLALECNTMLSGYIVIDEENSLSLEGDSLRPSDVVFRGTGKVQVKGNNYSFKSPTFENFELISGSLSLYEAYKLQDEANANVIVTGGMFIVDGTNSNVTLKMLSIRSGEVVINQPSIIETLKVYGGSLQGVGDITVSKLFAMDGGTIEEGNGAKIIIENDMQMSSTSSKLLKRDLILSGRVTWVSPGMSVSLDGKFTILESASLRVIGNDFTFAKSSVGLGVLDNYGVIDVDIRYGSFKADVQFNNHGSLIITSGDMQLAEQSEIGGVLKFHDLTSSIHITGGTHIMNPITLSNERLGKLRVEGGVVNVNDCRWTEVTVNGNSEVNITYISVTQPIIEMLSTSGGLTNIVTASSSTVRMTDMINDGGIIVFMTHVIALNITMRGGVLESRNKFDIVGNLDWMAGTFRGDHLSQTRIGAFGRANILGKRDKTIEDQTLEFASNTSWKCVGKIIMKRAKLLVRSTTTFSIEGKGSFESTDDTSIIQNHGSIELSAHTKLIVAAKIDNEGSVVVAESSLLDIQGNSYSVGRINIVSTGQLRFGSGDHRWSSVKEPCLVEGVLFIGAAGVMMSNCSVLGDIAVDKNGRLNFPVYGQDALSSSLTIEEDGVVEVISQEDIAVFQTIIINGGKAHFHGNMATENCLINNTKSSLIFDDFGQIEKLIWSAGTVQGARTSKMHVKSLVVYGSNDKILDVDDFLITDMADISGLGTLLLNLESDLIILQETVVHIRSPIVISSNRGSIINYGNVSVILDHHKIDGVVSFQGNFHNLGRITCGGRTTLSVTGTSVVSGQVNLLDHSSLFFQDGEHVLSQVTLTGDGSVKAWESSTSLSIIGAPKTINLKILRVSNRAKIVVGSAITSFDLIDVKNSGILTITEAVHLPALTLSGGTIIFQKKAIVDKFIFEDGTIDVTEDLFFDHFEWNGGVLSGSGAVITNNTRIRNDNLLTLAVTLKLTQQGIFSSGFKQIMTIEGAGSLVIAKDAVFNVYDHTEIISESSYVNRITNYGTLKFYLSAIVRSHLTNFGFVEAIGKYLKLEYTSNNFGRIHTGNMTVTYLHLFYASDDSEFWSGGNLTALEGKSNISSSVFNVQNLLVLSGELKIVGQQNSAFSISNVKLTGGKLALMGYDLITVDSIKVEGGTLNLATETIISNMTMSSGNLEPWHNIAITDFYFRGGSIVSQFIVHNFLVQRLFLHHSATIEKYIGHAILQIQQKGSWEETALIRDTLCIGNGGKLLIMKDATFAVAGDRYIHECNKQYVGVIENYGTFEVLAPQSLAPGAFTFLQTHVPFHNRALMIIADNSKVKFGNSVSLKGTFQSGMNTTVIIDNHRSLDTLQINCTTLEIMNSDVIVSSSSHLRKLILAKSASNVIFGGDGAARREYTIESIEIIAGILELRENLTVDHLEVKSGVIRKEDTSRHLINMAALSANIHPMTIKNIHVAVFDNVNMYGKKITIDSSNMLIRGKASIKTHFLLELLGGSTVVNEEVSVFEVNGRTFIQCGSDGTSCDFINSGSFLVNVKWFSCDANFHNNGTVVSTKDKSYITITVPDSSKSTGSYQLQGEGSTLTFFGDTGTVLLGNTSNLNNKSKVVLRGGKVEMLQTLQQNAELEVHEGTLILNKTALPSTENSVPIQSLSLMAGEVISENFLEQVPKVEIISGIFSGRGTIGLLNWKGGIISNADIVVKQMTFQSENSKTLRDGNITIINRCENTAGSTLNVTGSSVLLNKETSTFEISYPMKIYTSDSDNGQFRSAGGIVVSTQHQHETLFGLTFSSTGLINIQSGVLRIEGTTSFSGSIKSETGTKIHFGQGTHDFLDSSSLYGHGYIKIDRSASFNCAGNVTIDKLETSGSFNVTGITYFGIFRLYDGTATFSGVGEHDDGTSMGTLELHSGNLECPGLVAVNGPVFLHDGNISIGGTFYANSYLYVSAYVTVKGNINNQSDSCRNYTDCYTCIGHCTWNPSSNLCISKNRGGPDHYFEKDCSQDVDCFALNEPSDCSLTTDCLWCDWSDRCVRPEECNKTGDNFFWSSEKGGLWDDASNWRDGVLPYESSSVYIGYHSSNFIVHANNQVSVKSIIIGIPCQHSTLLVCDHIQELSIGNSFTVAENMTVHKNGRLTLNGNLDITGTLTIYGDFIWKWGVISGSGAIHVLGRMNICNTGAIFPTRHNTLLTVLENYGEVYYGNIARQLILTGNTITNHRSGTFHLESTSTVQSGTFYNYGVIKVEVDGYVPFGPITYNYGRLNIVKGSLQYKSDSFCNGTIDIGSDCILYFAGGHHEIRTECSISAYTARCISIYSASLVHFNASSYNISFLQITDRGVLEVHQELMLEKMYLDRAVIQGNGKIIINKLLQWKRGTVKCNVTTLGSTELMYTSGIEQKEIRGSTFTINGDLLVREVPGPLKLYSSSSIVLDEATFVHVEQGYSFTIESYSSPNNVYNYGTIHIDGTLQIKADFHSNGRILVERGKFVLSSNSKFSGGAIDMLTTGNIEFQGSEHNFFEDAGLTVIGTLTMKAQSLKIGSSSCQHIGAIIATSGVTEITNQTDLKSIGLIELQRSVLYIDTSFIEKIKIQSIVLKIDGVLNLQTDCGIHDFLFSGSGSSLKSIESAVHEVYGSFTVGHGYTTELEKGVSNVHGSVTASHGYQTDISKGLSNKGEMPIFKIYGTMHPNGLNIGSNYFIFHSLVHTDGPLKFQNDAKLTIMEHAQIGLADVTWSILSSGDSYLTNYGTMNVFGTSNIDVPFNNYGILQIYEGNGVRFSHTSKFISGAVNTMLDGWLSLRGGSKHLVQHLCELNFGEDGALYVYNSNTKLNITQGTFDGSIYLETAEVDLYSSEATGLLRYLKMDMNARLNMHTSDIKVNTLHLRKSTIDIGGGKLDIGFLESFTGISSSFYIAKLLNGKVNLIESQEYQNIGDPSGTLVKTHVDAELTIAPGYTLEWYGSNLYVEGTGSIINERHLLIPRNKFVEMKPSFISYANLTIVGGLRIIRAGEISNAMLNFIDDGYLSVHNGYFIFSNVTFSNIGRIFSYEGTLDIHGQRLNHDTNGKGISLLVRNGFCKITNMNSDSIISFIELISSATMEIYGDGSDAVFGQGLIFNPWSSFNAKLSILTHYKVEEFTMKSYRSNSLVEVKGVLEVTKNMTWNCGILSGSLYIAPKAHLYFVVSSSVYMKEIHNGHIKIDGKATTDNKYAKLGLLDSVINVTNTWLFENTFEFYKKSGSKASSPLYNYGTMRIKAPSGTVAIRNDIFLHNYGIIMVEEGTFSISSVAFLGQIRVGTAACLEFDSTVTHLNGSNDSIDLPISNLRISGASHIDIDGITNNIKHLFLDSGEVYINQAENLQIEMITINGGTLFVNTDFHVKKVVLKSGTIDGNGALRTKVMDVYGGKIKIGSTFSYPGLIDMIGRITDDDYTSQEEANSCLIIDDWLITRSSSTVTIESGLLVLNGGIRQDTVSNIQINTGGVLIFNGEIRIFRDFKVTGSVSSYVINSLAITVDTGLTSDTGLDLASSFLNDGTVTVASGKLYSNPNDKAKVYGQLEVLLHGLFFLARGDYHFTNSSSFTVFGSMTLDAITYRYYKFNVVFDQTSDNIFINNLNMPYSGSNVQISGHVDISNILLSRGTLEFHGNPNIQTLEMVGGLLKVKKNTSIQKLLFSGGEIYSDGKRSKLTIKDFAWLAGKIQTSNTVVLNVDITDSMCFIGSSWKYLDYNVLLTLNGYGLVATTGEVRLYRSTQLIVSESSHLFHQLGTIQRQNSQEAIVVNRGTITSGKHNVNANIMYNIPVQNLGKVSVDDGNLKLNMGGSSAICETTSSSSIEISGGTFNISTQDISGEGRFVQTGGVLAIVSGGTLSMPVTIESGVLQINQDAIVTVADILIDGGTLRVHGALTITKSLDFRAGTIEGDGILILEKTSVASVYTSALTTTSRIASLQNHGIMKIYSTINVASGEIRNEETGRVIVSESGSLTGNGLLTNAGVIEIVSLHPEHDAEIKTALHNIGLIESNQSNVIFHPTTSLGQRFSVHSRVTGSHVTLVGTLQAGGTFTSDTVISGNVAIPEAVILDGVTIWSGGSIYGKDKCQDSSYNPASNSLMLPVCPEQYIMNKGQLTISDVISSPTRSIGQHLDIVNQGELFWIGGEVKFEGPILNLGVFYIQGPSVNAILSNRHTAYTMKNHGIILVNDTFADLRSATFTNAKTLDIFHQAHLYIGSYIQNHDLSLLHVRTGSSFEALNVIISNGVMKLGGSLLGNVDVGNAKFSVVDMATVTGDLKLGNESVFHININELLQDKVAAHGDVSLNGKLLVESEDYVPAAGKTFTIIAFIGNLNGQFSVVESTVPSTTFYVMYGTSNITIVAN